MHNSLKVVFIKKQPFIKAGVNKLKTKRERYAFLKTMQQALLELLQFGFNPDQDNSALEKNLFSVETTTKTNGAKENQQKSNNHATSVQQTIGTKETPKNEEATTSISEAFKKTLDKIYFKLS